MKMIVGMKKNSNVKYNKRTKKKSTYIFLLYRYRYTHVRTTDRTRASRFEFSLSSVVEWTGLGPVLCFWRKGKEIVRDSRMKYGQKAKEILLELKRCDFLPPYNDSAIRDIVREINSLFQNIFGTLKDLGERTKDIATMTGLTVFNQSLLRDKRCLLSYLYWRMNRAVELRWETGRVIPSEIKSNFGPMEIEFFQHYDRALGSYMRAVDLDLTAYSEPPKQPFIEVRALKDCGNIVSSDGSSIRLDKNTTNLVRRSDVEHLIKQGLLEQLA